MFVSGVVWKVLGLDFSFYDNRISDGYWELG